MPLLFVSGVYVPRTLGNLLVTEAEMVTFFSSLSSPKEVYYGRDHSKYLVGLTVDTKPYILHYVY